MRKIMLKPSKNGKPDNEVIQDAIDSIVNEPALPIGTGKVKLIKGSNIKILVPLEKGKPLNIPDGTFKVGPELKIPRNLKLMFKCPKCGKKFEVKEPGLGEIMTMECPHCHARGDFLDAPNTIYRVSGILKDGRIVREDEKDENNQ